MNTLCTNYISLVWSNSIFACKIISLKQVRHENFKQSFIVEIFLWLQNHFLENNLLPKIFNIIFGSKFFYCFKIISSKTESYQKFSTKLFGRKFFVVAKSFPRKQVWTKNLHNNILVENFLWLQYNFLENRFEPKIIIKFFLFEGFLLIQNHFLANRFEPKIFIKMFLVENFFGCKIISSKTGSYQKIKL